MNHLSGNINQAVSQEFGPFFKAKNIRVRISCITAYHKLSKGFFDWAGIPAPAQPDFVEINLSSMGPNGVRVPCDSPEEAQEWIDRLDRVFADYYGEKTPLTSKVWDGI